LRPRRIRTRLLEPGAAVVAALLLVGCGSHGARRPAPTPRLPTFKLTRAAAERSGDPLSYAIYDHLLDVIDFAHEERDLRRMTPGQRALYALASVDGEIENGGFAQLFSNSTGSLIDDAVTGSRLFRARGYERLLARASTLFPRRVVPEDRERRNRELNQIPDRSLTQLDDAWFSLYERDPLDRYYERYVSRHPDEFLGGGR
jgi:hypothetical protein